MGVERVSGANRAPGAGHWLGVDSGMPIPLLLADPALGSTFGTRDIAGLIFIGVAIALIWVGFLHMQGLTEREIKEKPPIDPPPPTT